VVISGPFFRFSLSLCLFPQKTVISIKVTTYSHLCSLAGLQNAALYNGSSFVQWGRIGGDAVIAVTVDNESDTIFIAKQMAGGRIPTSISMWRFDGTNSQDNSQRKKYTFNKTKMR
jgi:hypothetical protein